MKKSIKFFGTAVLSLSLALASSSPAFAYDVRPGDTFYGIALKNGITLSELQQLNPDVEDIGRIFPGQKINIPNESGKGNNTTDYAKGLTSADISMLRSMFDAKYYAKNNEDVVEVFGNTAERLFEHFLAYGLWETRQPNADFNVNAYATYPDLFSAFGNNVVEYYRHYNNCGKIEPRIITTVEQALEIYEEIKSISPLNKPDSEEKMFGTVLFTREEENESIFNIVVMNYYNTMEIAINELIGFIDEKGIYSSGLQTMYLSKPVIGEGRYIDWCDSLLNSASQAVRGIEDRLSDDDKALYARLKGKIIEIEEEISELRYDMSVLDEIIAIRMECLPSKTLDQYLDEYDKDTEDWESAFNAQNFAAAFTDPSERELAENEWIQNNPMPDMQTYIDAFQREKTLKNMEAMERIKALGDYAKEYVTAFVAV